MEENEYRGTYHDYNQQRCLFEKSILSRNTMCIHAHRFNLADREGVSCQNQAAQSQCRLLLDNLRDKARFALKQTRVDEPLPHAKEIKIQTGGLLGLQTILNQTTANGTIENIHGLVQQAISRYGDIDALPYDEITRKIVTFEGRNRRRVKR